MRADCECSGFQMCHCEIIAKTANAKITQEYNDAAISQSCCIDNTGLRSVEHVGGLDNWLAKTSNDKLSPRVQKLKREIAKAQKAAN